MTHSWPERAKFRFEQTDRQRKDKVTYWAPCRSQKSAAEMKSPEAGKTETGGIKI